MKRQLLIVTVFLVIEFLFLTSCGETNTKNSVSKSRVEKLVIDTSSYTIINFDSIDNWPGFHDVTSTTLTDDEIQEIEKVLKECIDNYNPRQQKLFDSLSKAHPNHGLLARHYVIDLSRYKRQYVPVLNSKGQKEVWINCLCSGEFGDWRNGLVMANDGGNCYLTL